MKRDSGDNTKSGYERDGEKNEEDGEKNEDTKYLGRSSSKHTESTVMTFGTLVY